MSYLNIPTTPQVRSVLEAGVAKGLDAGTIIATIRTIDGMHEKHWRILISWLEEAEEGKGSLNIPPKLLTELLELARQPLDEAARNVLLKNQQYPLRKWGNDNFAQAVLKAEQWLELRGLLGKE